MKKQHTILTQFVSIDVTIQTNDVLSHSRMTGELSKNYTEAIERGLDYMRGQFKSIEQQYHEILIKHGN